MCRAAQSAHCCCSKIGCRLYMYRHRRWVVPRDRGRDRDLESLIVIPFLRLAWILILILILIVIMTLIPRSRAMAFVTFIAILYVRLAMTFIAIPLLNLRLAMTFIAIPLLFLSMAVAASTFLRLAMTAMTMTLLPGAGSTRKMQIAIVLSLVRAITYQLVAMSNGCVPTYHATRNKSLAFLCSWSGID